MFCSFYDEKNIVYSWSTNGRGPQENSPLAEVLTYLEKYRQNRRQVQTLQSVTHKVVSNNSCMFSRCPIIKYGISVVYNVTDMKVLG